MPTLEIFPSVCHNSVMANPVTKTASRPPGVTNRVIDGQLEIDFQRGVIYFHDKSDGMTVLRICRLNLPNDLQSIDITHMVGVSTERRTDESRT